MKGKYFRLDGYSAEGRQVLSMKSGQYGGTDTAAKTRIMRALDELRQKYRAGYEIADVPSAPRGLAGKPLRGRLMLGIPVQAEPLDPSVLRHAEDLGIQIAEIDIPVPKIGR